MCRISPSEIKEFMKNEIKKLQKAQLAKTNILMMLDKIKESLAHTNGWEDLDDAGWAFLRMLDMQRVVYLPDCPDSKDEFYENLRVKDDKLTLSA